MNRLAGEASPYLRQHRDNPVDWYPWGSEAFAAAEQRDVPILLSVGYSACHWCHVMAHESFEDPAVAAAMNAAFVNVKVDREERPDVDSIYMDAVQAMTKRGGWPMTAFLTPKGEPFFGGTYFPKPAFLQLLGAVSAAWRDRREELTRNVEPLRQAMGASARLQPGEGVPSETLVVVAVDPGRVGVLGGREAGPRQAEVAQHELDDAPCHVSPPVGAEGDRGAAVHAQQQRLVVQHLLEVGDEPLAVDRVAGEPPSHVVVHPAGGHRIEAHRHGRGHLR